MRTVREPGRLPEALAAARREAMAAFGDDRLILERLLEGARHIEIQVLFDADGHGVHLGERDCSIQRRHQKVLEESPSPAVDADLRHRLGVAALRLARRVGYVNAGTCEFLVDDRGDPAFLEMNTRLQVEHPVTELVTGRDLVADQLRIAAGERLGFDSETVHPTGHAVEVRLYAEDAEAGFLPATGRVERLRWPSGEGIRVDAGIDPGTEIGDRFDPMLAKIVAWGPDRATAFERLAGALDATVVLGVVTNLRFLRWLVRQPVVLAGEARTDTLDRIWPPDDWSARAEIPDERLADGRGSPGGGRRAGRSVGGRLAAQRRADPGPRRRGAGPIGPARSSADALERGGRVRGRPRRGYRACRCGGSQHGFPHRAAARRRRDGPCGSRPRPRSASGPVELLAPMPGAVLRVHVPVGGVVAAGDPVVTLEAMKMEHVVVTSIAGRIADVRVRAADQVTRGQLLAVVEP